MLWSLFAGDFALTSGFVLLAKPSDFCAYFAWEVSATAGFKGTSFFGGSILEETIVDLIGGGTILTAGTGAFTDGLAFVNAFWWNTYSAWLNEIGSDFPSFI